MSFAPPTAMHLDNHQPFHCVPRFPVVGALQIVGRMTKDPHFKMKFSPVSNEIAGLDAEPAERQRRKRISWITGMERKEESYIRSIYNSTLLFQKNARNPQYYKA